MAVTVVSRRRICAGGRWMDLLITSVAANLDGVESTVHYAYNLGSLVPISATANAGDMAFSFTAVTGYPSKSLITMTQTAANERACVILEGY